MRMGLLVFAREPKPGAVKSRLARDTGQEMASRLYAGMLMDVLSKAAALEQMDILVFWSSTGGVIPAYPHLPRLSMFVQQGDTLGERMQNAFRHAFSSGIQACCIVGTDSPDLPTDFITQAFRLLEQSDTDIVFGPAEDGGYYLAGMKQLHGRLFSDIQWSTSSVLSDSLNRASELQLKTALLPPWYDIDTLSDLQRFCRSKTSSAPHTREAVRQMNDEKHPHTEAGLSGHQIHLNLMNIQS